MRKFIIKFIAYIIVFALYCSLFYLILFIASLRAYEIIEKPLSQDSSKIYCLEPKEFYLDNVFIDFGYAQENIKSCGLPEFLKYNTANAMGYEQNTSIEIRYDRLFILLLEEVRKLKIEIEDLKNESKI
jgi:hypothetical protein